MLKGTCPNSKCGKVYFGWALQVPEKALCECGEKLVVVDTEKSDQEPKEE